MGDGVEPFIRGMFGCGLAGIVGLAHGVVDSTEFGRQLPNAAHVIATYAPLGFAAAYTGSSRYGLWTVGEKIGGGAVAAGIASALTGAGYVVGRVLAEGYKTVVGSHISFH